MLGMRKIEDVLADVRSDEECERCSYCPLAVLIKLNPRTLEQHKMVEVWKYLESERAKTDIGWEAAYQTWVSSGKAKRFAEVYSEDKTFRQMKKEMFDE